MCKTVLCPQDSVSKWKSHGVQMDGQVEYEYTASQIQKISKGNPSNMIIISQKVVFMLWFTKLIFYIWV